MYSMCVPFLLVVVGLMADSDIVYVKNAVQLREIVDKIKPGTQVLLLPGEYEGGLYFKDIKGEPAKPIIIGAADPCNPPVIRGGGECLHFSSPAYLELRNLVLEGARYNGLNIDDSGNFELAAHHIKLIGLKVRNIGPIGNCDGIKLSGVRNFEIYSCVIERWGDGGQGIDMVGCHNGLIKECYLQYEDDKGYGIQAKGGSSYITIRSCKFEHAGARAVQIGGSTDLQFFRPPLKRGEAHSEAAHITVEGSIFIGSIAAIAFTGADGAIVRFNTIYWPKRWAFRILQETRVEGFVPCRNVLITNNLIAFYSHDWYEGGINIGPGTAPHTFKFARNWWYCIDCPPNSIPALPLIEEEGVYGIDPQFIDPENGNLLVKPTSSATMVGAHGFMK